MSNDRTFADFSQLQTAEDFFHFFQINYEPEYFRSIRIPVLKRFHGYKFEIDAVADEPSEACLLERYKEAFSKAYREISGDQQMVYSMYQGTSSCLSCSRKQLCTEKEK